MTDRERDALIAFLRRLEETGKPFHVNDAVLATCPLCGSSERIHGLHQPSGCELENLIRVLEGGK